MFLPPWYAVAFGAAALSSLAGFLALLRLRQLKALGRLSAELAEYYAPMLKSPVASVHVGFNLAASQRSRIAQGRGLKLAFSGHHREIGDPWLTAWVLIQRLGGAVFLGAFLGMIILGSTIPGLG